MDRVNCVDKCIRSLDSLKFLTLNYSSHVFPQTKVLFFFSEHFKIFFNEKDTDGWKYKCWLAGRRCLFQITKLTSLYKTYIQLVSQTSCWQPRTSRGKWEGEWSRVKVKIPKNHQKFCDFLKLSYSCLTIAEVPNIN